MAPITGRPFWIPRYNAYFPEYYLTGIQTETLIRDLSPLRGENVYRTHTAATRIPPARRPRTSG